MPHFPTSVLIPCFTNIMLRTVAREQKWVCKCAGGRQESYINWRASPQSGLKVNMNAFVRLLSPLNWLHLRADCCSSPLLPTWLVTFLLLRRLVSQRKFGLGKSSCPIESNGCSQVHNVSLSLLSPALRNFRSALSHVKKISTRTTKPYQIRCFTN